MGPRAGLEGRGMYTGINYTKSLALGARNVNEVMSQVGTVREVVCTQINVFPQ